MSFFVKACIAACKAFAGVNAEVVGGHIVYKKHYAFGIAVSTPKGLVVPVLRDCDALSFAGIESGILALAEKARTGKLALADLSGGTFSITNGGIYGSMMSTPLLNYPQTGILGMHNIVKRAVVVGEAVVVRPMMYIALSYDHRVVDGREAVSSWSRSRIGSRPPTACCSRSEAGRAHSGPFSVIAMLCIPQLMRRRPR
jgi:2-oxoglutarate dehydrogenase E2 component (dihydrolipoamide succinyltransferase)